MRPTLPSLLTQSCIALATLMFSVAFHDPARAAETDQIYLVLSAKFKPGKAPEAFAIIHDHFHKVDKTIGRKAIPFDYQTGEWDHVVYFPFDPVKGETIPSWADWMKALAAQEGGMQQAQKLFDRFWELTASSRTEMARLPAPWVP